MDPLGPREERVEPARPDTEGAPVDEDQLAGGALQEVVVADVVVDDVVEDVEAIRAPQPGRDLALAIDSRLQYLAFRELKSAVEVNKAKAGGLVIIDVRTGEILALANWPTYNPNARNRIARERMSWMMSSSGYRSRSLW